MPEAPTVTAGAALAARIEDAYKIYGTGDAEVRALNGVTRDFRAGAFTAIMGPSGSGKSTLMQCMAGLDRLTSGKTWIGDAELTGMSEKQITQVRRDRVGFIFQSFNLVPTLNAIENIRLPLDIAGRKPDQAMAGPGHRRPQPAEAPHAPPLRALGRPAAARGRRPRPGVAARHHLRRRAHRAARLPRLGRAARLHAPRGRRLRPDDRARDPRAGRCQPSRPGAVPRRRADRGRAGPADAGVDPRPHEDDRGRVRGHDRQAGLPEPAGEQAPALPHVAGGGARASASSSARSCSGDTINSAFDGVFETATKGVAVQVRGVKTVSDADRQPVPADAAAHDRGGRRGRAAPRAASSARPRSSARTARRPASTARPRSASAGPTTPTSTRCASRRARRRAPRTTWSSTRPPPTTRASSPGDTIRIITASGSAEYRLVGIVAFGDQNNIAGATLAAFTLGDGPAHLRLRRPLRHHRRHAPTRASATPSSPVASRRCCPRATRPSPARRRRRSRATSSSSSWTSSATSCSAFAAHRPLRGQLHHLQRVQDHGRPAHPPDRAAARRGRVRQPGDPVGAPRGRSSSASIASIIGIIFGIAFAALLRAGFNALGASLPATTLQIEPRSIIVGLVVGLVVTLAAAVIPAWKASRVPPIAAMRDTRGPRLAARPPDRVDHASPASACCWCWAGWSPPAASRPAVHPDRRWARCCCSSARRCSPSTSRARWPR